MAGYDGDASYSEEFQINWFFNPVSVMRTQGSLRLILNTKVWPGMTVMRASQKSIRLTATDGDEGIKVFLLVVGPFNLSYI